MNSWEAIPWEDCCLQCPCCIPGKRYPLLHSGRLVSAPWGRRDVFQGWLCCGRRHLGEALKAKSISTLVYWRPLECTQSTDVRLQEFLRYRKILSSLLPHKPRGSDKDADLASPRKICVHGHYCCDQSWLSKWIENMSTSFRTTRFLPAWKWADRKFRN